MATLNREHLSPCVRTGANDGQIERHLTMQMLMATIKYLAGDLMRLRFYLKKGTSMRLVTKHLIPILPLTSEKTVHCLENTMCLSKIPFKLKDRKSVV